MINEKQIEIFFGGRTGSRSLNQPPEENDKKKCEICQTEIKKNQQFCNPCDFLMHIYPGRNETLADLHDRILDIRCQEKSEKIAIEGTKKRNREIRKEAFRTGKYFCDTCNEQIDQKYILYAINAEKKWMEKYPWAYPISALFCQDCQNDEVNAEDTL